MEATKIRLGYCPTRRDVFDKNAAIEYGKKIKDYISKFEDVEIVDIDGINEENLLFQDCDIETVIKRFCENEIDALFFPHCNFGSENRISQVAKAFDVPVLLWGPRDEEPDQITGLRTRDTQCGLFATGKVLRRHNIEFTYLTNTVLESDYFKERFEKFLQVASVVKSMKDLRILQISTRPEAFCSVICNEGELLEKFNVHVYPVTLNDLVVEMDRIIAENGEDYQNTYNFIRTYISKNGNEDGVTKTAAMKVAMKNLAKQYRCRAVAIQCWNSLQDITHIMPCLANSLLSDEGIPVVCETDINGAITAVMMQAVTMNKKSQFFADLTIRHHEKENMEMLWHCGVFPYSMAKNKESAYAGEHWILPSKAFGTCMWQIENGDVTIARFDGDHGEYSMFVGEAKAVDGPTTGGSYTWIEVDNWAKWEHKLVYGPYIHHVSGIYDKAADVLVEACKYIKGVKADIVETQENEARDRWL
ncbi:MAG: L-fucose/L-arabinose isomerase family protein [Clostridia bacterium]|nr:L-fucose/L-arabinose isomerase family protein [Clostridia bacterium]